MAYTYQPMDPAREAELLAKYRQLQSQGFYDQWEDAPGGGLRRVSRSNTAQRRPMARPSAPRQTPAPLGPAVMTYPPTPSAQEQQGFLDSYYSGAARSSVPPRGFAQSGGGLPGTTMPEPPVVTPNPYIPGDAAANAWFGNYAAGMASPAPAPMPMGPDYFPSEPAPMGADFFPTDAGSATAPWSAWSYPQNYSYPIDEYGMPIVQQPRPVGPQPRGYISSRGGLPGTSR